MVQVLRTPDEVRVWQVSASVHPPSCVWFGGSTRRRSRGAGAGCRGVDEGV